MLTLANSVDGAVLFSLFCTHVGPQIFPKFFFQHVNVGIKVTFGQLFIVNIAESGTLLQSLSRLSQWQSSERTIACAKAAPATTTTSANAHLLPGDCDMVSPVVIFLQQLLEVLLAFRDPALLLFTRLHQSLDENLEHQTQNRVFGLGENLDTPLLDRLGWFPAVVGLRFVKVYFGENSKYRGLKGYETQKAKPDTISKPPCVTSMQFVSVYAHSNGKCTFYTRCTGLFALTSECMRMELH